jgi:hypothetical protein
MAEQQKQAAENNGKSNPEFRAPQPKPGLNIAPPTGLRKMRRSIGGTVAYLASWWRY